LVSVIGEALATSEPFEWGYEFSSRPLSKAQHALLDEAAQFKIRCGFTVPVHDPRGPIAAVTFAADERRAVFRSGLEHNKHVLQLMAMYCHAHAPPRLTPDRVVDGVALSPRQFDCLEWAALEGGAGVGLRSTSGGSRDRAIPASESDLTARPAASPIDRTAAADPSIRDAE
jgi:hypothetical protein